MRWYTAIGMKKDDADGRFCVWVDGEEKVLTEMETILWAALTWSFCEEDKVHSQMHRLLVFSLGEKQAQEWADKEDFQFCLNRLVKRGLVVLTEGCTREEAVYSIISRSVMAPMIFSPAERMKHFMESLSMGKDSLQEQIQREFISRVAQLYYKKQLVIDNIRREDCLEANGTSVLAQAV